MKQPYRWPDPEACRTLNSLLNLPATGKEQDWEIEFAHGDRLAEMLALFTDGDLDLECRSALALLMLSSCSYPGVVEPPEPLVNAIQNALRRDGDVRHRMLEYWSDGFLENEALVAAILD